VDTELIRFAEEEVLIVDARHGTRSRVSSVFAFQGCGASAAASEEVDSPLPPAAIPRTG
jgi:hypothetical protein